MTDLVKWLRVWPEDVEEFEQCAEEIERLRSDLAKWKARAQVMRECLLAPAITWDELVDEKPEAADWFDENGVPR
jgi:hypothetical protein